MRFTVKRNSMVKRIFLWIYVIAEQNSDIVLPGIDHSGNKHSASFYLIDGNIISADQYPQITGISRQGSNRGNGFGMMLQNAQVPCYAAYNSSGCDGIL